MEEEGGGEASISSEKGWSQVRCFGFDSEYQKASRVDVKRVTFKNPIVESGQAKPEVPKPKEKLPVHNAKSQLGCLLGLPHWQER